MTGAAHEAVTNDGALSEDDLDRLRDFLDTMGPPAMNLESVDGFFAALICGPEMVMPGEYLPVVFGEDAVFADDAEAADMLGLLMRCRRRSKFEPPCRANSEPGLMADRVMVGCG